MAIGLLLLSWYSWLAAYETSALRRWHLLLGGLSLGCALGFGMELFVCLVTVAAALGWVALHASRGDRRAAALDLATFAMPLALTVLVFTQYPTPVLDVVRVAARAAAVETDPSVRAAEELAQAAQDLATVAVNQARDADRRADRMEKAILELRRGGVGSTASTSLVPAEARAQASLQLDQARSIWEQASGAVEQAERTIERARALQAQAAPSSAATTMLDQAITGLKDARASLKNARASLEKARVNLERTRAA